MQGTEAKSVPRRPLGRTGESVSIVGLGGFHIGKPELSDEESVGIIRTAIDGGITFMDNSWDYHDGLSETRMGRALQDGYRERAFLMTKVDGRDRRTAARQLDESLRRLRTDHVDLLQFHEIIHGDDPSLVFAPGGALEAAVEAREDGRVRFIGFTGHKSPVIHNRMLDAAEAAGFRFDTVQMPLNALDAHYDSFERTVLPRLVGSEIAVLGMKPLASGKLVEEGAAGATECLRYALSLPVSVVITGCDSMRILEQALHAARTFVPMGAGEREELLSRTAPAATGGRLEEYKTTVRHDSTTQNPQWMGDREALRAER